jgi:hypothetical protein
MMTHILFNLADVLDQACAILEEERGQPLAADVEEAIADRITRCARAGDVTRKSCGPMHSKDTSERNILWIDCC